MLSGFNTSSVEVGTAYSFNASMAFSLGEINNGNNTLAGTVSGNALTFKLTNPDGVEYNNNSVSSNSDTTTTAQYVFLNSGTRVWVFSATNAVGTTTYTDNKGNLQNIASIENAKADTIPSNVTKSKKAYIPPRL